MEGICRLCLSISNESVPNLFCDNLIALKMKSCFSITIESNALLPNQICCICLNKLNEASEFRTKVIENESILIENLKNGDINNLYLNLRNKLKLKEESHNLLEDKENTLTNVNIKTVHEEVKQELEDNIDTYTSDDEFLSKLKQNKIESEVKIKDKIKPITETHKCLTCFYISDSKANLMEHYKSVHDNKKESDNIREYTVETSGGTAAYRCKICSKEYRSKKNIHRHMTGHSDQRPFLCKICGRTYKTASEIIRHSRVHSGSKLLCSYQCGYSTAYMGALKAHERRHDKVEYKYKCEKCGKGFEVKTWYEQHQNVHRGLKPFVCDICGVAFHMDRYLTSHRSSVHPQSSNMKRYVCVHCSLPCDSKNALKEHLEEHGVKTSFLCDLCGKTLSNSEQLKFHKRMHSGEKPYTCSTCNKCFAKKFNLKVHQRTHTGERACACARCGRGYTQRSSLLRHYSRHHDGTEPLDCARCQKSFPSRNQLKVHQKNCVGLTSE